MSGFDNTTAYGGEGAGPASVGEDIYNTGASGSGSKDGGGGLKRSVPRAQKKMGHHKPVHDPRLFRTYDRVAGLSKAPVPFDASRDDRMSKEDAGFAMESIVKRLGMTGEKPEVLEALHRAIFYSHAINGSSVLQPGRATITVAGTTFDYSTIVLFLGEAQRRFFRAFADEVLNNNKRILMSDDPDDIVALEQASMLRQVASARGLSRFPHLCHDSADACSDLSDTESSALLASKAMVFATTPNMADRGRFRPGQSGASEAGLMYVAPSAQVSAGRT